jgi:hypothetical protein
MSTSIHVVGFTPPNEEWKNMKSVYDACKAAKLEVPEEVEEFFNWEEPDEAGVEVDLEKSGVAREWHAEMRDGYEIDVESIPEHIKKIRFFRAC